CIFHCSHDDLKIGCLVGTDQFGNKYYENNNYFFGRNRWVEYSPAFGFDYDASMIPPEWFGWIHYRTDYRPCEDPTRPFYSWQKPHVMNLSGTPDEYVPYDTTRPKIEQWVPPKPECHLAKSALDTKTSLQTDINHHHQCSPPT
ncbi:NADH dehydrogenase [ubiquinone] 1 alpha subcomplex subunit 12-like, partial [Thrips palmi]|uniref:NADH dehydrogenase [ubiquinone] 1 alpha subcomplex subunit 12 n=1 Tax=Thrips palmi TaxID=161013 RepID=A0A6P9AGA3_THRPL